MNKVDQSLLESWNEYGQYLAYAVAGIGVLVILSYFLKLKLIRDFKKKYDYINKFEVNLLWNGALLIMIAIAVYANTLVDSSAVLWFTVRVFVSTMMGIMLGVVVQNVLKFYYPFYIEKRLKKLRYKPRLSPEGNPLKLLSEEEEDVYLDEGMQAEEEVFSVDYDVWIDEKTGFTKIEKYNGRFHALKCPECSYQTLRITKEEVIRPATYEEKGMLTKYYTCRYCGHKESKEYSITQLRQ